MPLGGPGAPPPPPPPPPPGAPPPPPPPGPSGSHGTLLLSPDKSKTKLIRLHWEEIRPISTNIDATIWKSLSTINIDKEELGRLFEAKARSPINKPSDSIQKKENIIVLDSKRSNGINIALVKLPPVNTIKSAILKMDNECINREGIERLLSLIPTTEEISKIAEAVVENPGIPLATAEAFLQTISTIPELEARLRLWAFKIDYGIIEKGAAEALMDLKQGLKQLQESETFKYTLSTILTVGNTLNGKNAAGFSLNYLTKIPEIKDTTTNKQSLLTHVAKIVMSQYPDSSDLYSDFGALHRSAKVDFEELEIGLVQLEKDCKAAWIYLRAIVKHDSKSSIKPIMTEFLTDVGERLLVLKVVYTRILNRFNNLLLFYGFTKSIVKDMRINDFLKIVTEFSLEYKTVKGKLLDQARKKEVQRKRSETRGRLITDVSIIQTLETNCTKYNEKVFIKILATKIFSVPILDCINTLMIRNFHQ
ncbi:uncharacterized protein TRIADDRAFT_24577 [Trichoplax adhaerens]|uniref:FH2 domain-containing protein n=1 Tax=Trichoplax adhaerens TaxID=10228 RepID=B3RV80_TRIAD|nr:hypothetical protein TRIADDRAFT_24577 [Trichoplax adhaerens]EDV25456.1 hypothetical protein TRIADDRAFT_24577 [Trichoplax adhaerens]|eukprot:XP_002111489.1 hypothetical protein TRIADDRAFT_24577 [Trichoplax adhaerens]